jgi:diadenosine tetraphosphate (Ap4A) HIT family hydrolase
MPLDDHERQAELRIWENPFYRAEQCSSCPLPGYLILSPRDEVRSFAEMTPEALSALGHALVLSTKIIERVVKPERIYYARFGEAWEGIHLHLFPRTAWLLEAFRRDHPDSPAVVSGPKLLHWARERYDRDSVNLFSRPSLQEAIAAMSEYARTL